MSVIRLQDITKQYDQQLILREVFFRLDQSDRVGLIGKNGAGKTTLLKLILKQEFPDDGTVEIDEGLRIGYFSQFTELTDDVPIDRILESVFIEIQATERALNEVGKQLESPELKPLEMEHALTRQAALLENMDRKAGWTYRHRIDTALSRLGFSDQYRSRPVGALSGGWRNRAALAKLLLESPDVLLLDEPTNFLDLAGLAWLESWLLDFSGGVILVSHDRHFIDQVVNRVVEVENYHLQEYKGNYSEYVRKKQIRFKNLENQFEHEATLLVLESEAIEDRRAARKNPSEHLKRKLANIKKEKPTRPVENIVTDIYQGLRVRDNLCLVEHLMKSYDSQVIMADLSFSVHRGDRLAVIGPNGIGKSTLIRLLTEQELPDSGMIKWAGGVEYIFFNQIIEELDPNESVTKYVNFRGMAFNTPRKQVNRFLALLRFTDLDIYRQIKNLSGGERARVALAVCLLSGASVVILDEPTNHLDVTTTQVMEAALAHFPGALIVASHDRFFIDKLANRLLVFEEGGRLRIVAGNWTTWQASADVD